MTQQEQAKSANTHHNQKIINDAIDTASLAIIYHDQASALFNAIESLVSDPKHTQTVQQLCSIGYLLSDEAGNAANCSQEAFQGVSA